MTVLEFVKWAFEEHPFLSFFAMMFAAKAISGIGRIGSTSTTVTVKQRKPEKSNA